MRIASAGGALVPWEGEATHTKIGLDAASETLNGAAAALVAATAMFEEKKREGQSLL